MLGSDYEYDYLALPYLTGLSLTGQCFALPDEYDFLALPRQTPHRITPVHFAGI